MLPLVSILIPAYNAQAWISETIQSALSQTWARKEIIVVNDGSTDDTLSIVRRYESSMLKIIHQENGGACRARNRALSECQGDYIQWLDADDLLAPNKIERQLRVAQDEVDPHVLFASAWGRFYYTQSKVKFEPTPLWQDVDAAEWLVLWLANPWMIPPHAWLVSRQLTDEAGPWDEQLTRDQDGEYFCRVVSHSSYIKFVSESRSYYRMANTSSLSNTTTRKAWESICRSTELTIGHVLAHENSERTRTACISRLNRDASMLEIYAPDLALHLHQRIKELGGKILPEKISRKYAFVQRIIGARNALRLKEAEWRARRRIYGSYERLLAKFVGS
jgi:glycosyltransferase involved in cell wall biosynthesis